MRFCRKSFRAAIQGYVVGVRGYTLRVEGEEDVDVCSWPVRDCRRRCGNQRLSASMSLMTFLDLCFFPSFVTAVGVAVPELGGEGVFNCGANALASTRAISFSSQC